MTTPKRSIYFNGGFFSARDKTKQEQQWDELIDRLSQRRKERKQVTQTAIHLQFVQGYN